MKPKVGIVMVNYNGEKFQNDCLASLREITYTNFMTIIVDNASVDNSVEMVKKKYPEVFLLEMGENLGVAKANNIGINYAIENNCDYVLLLNNDTEVQRDFLTNLVEKADEKTLVVPKMYYYEPNNMIWCAGGEIDWKKAVTIHYGMKEMDDKSLNKESYIEYSPTCCMLIHKSVFSNIGLMDEKYFMYYDDTDFCVRATASGYKILYQPKSIIWHKVSSSSGGEESLTSIYYGNRNRLYFIDKFYKKKHAVKTFYYVTRIIKLLYWLFKGQKKKIETLYKAILDYHRREMGIRR
ncbi:glycosyltransferase family 2 protein [Cohnella xylanilytica]|uniref:glycosyltransferase family 2 protein n=1 Tax=Cohnella xylanilytica TaxID=557555 RepID=UPI001BB40DF5|nr:glycosyltransferase family 2 protein [Cohnella xylanilytica]